MSGEGNVTENLFHLSSDYIVDGEKNIWISVHFYYLVVITCGEIKPTEVEHPEAFSK